MNIFWNNTYFGVNQSGVSSLFQSANRASSGGNVFSNSVFYKGLSEVNSTSYKNLLKKYYAEDTESESSDSSGTLDKLINQSNAATNATAAKELKTDAANLKDSADKITKVDKDGNNELFTKDREEIDKAIKNMINNYNELVTSVSNNKSNNTHMDSLKNQFKSLSSAAEYSLKNVGITANYDGTLSIDSKKYEAADIDTLKDVFTGKYSFAERASEKAEYVEKNAARYVTDGFGTYNQNSKYNNLWNTGNLFNNFF